MFSTLTTAVMSTSIAQNVELWAKHIALTSSEESALMALENHGYISKKDCHDSWFRSSATLVFFAGSLERVYI